MELTQPQAERTPRERRIYWGARGAALAAAVAALVMIVLLAFSWQTADRARPSDAPAMTELRRRIAAEPRDSMLREQARDLDLLARQAYVASIAFRRRGAVLLLVALTAMFASLKLMSATARRVPEASFRNDDDPDLRTMTSAAVCCFIAFLGGFAFMMARERAPAAWAPAEVAAAPIVDAAAAPVAPPAVAAVDETLAATYWPAFRGWRGVGLGGKQTPPSGWDGPSGSNILWRTKTELPGFNSPVVWGDRVFVSGADQYSRAVYAFHAISGAALWDADVTIANAPDEALSVIEDTGYAAPTLACDSRQVYAIFANGDLIALDHEGRERWSRRLPVARIAYGYASSLLAYGGRLFVQCDVGARSALLAFDGATGAELWRAPRDEESAWSSPAMAEGVDGPILILNGVKSVTAYAPDTGYKLWSAPGMHGEIAPSPACADGLVAVAMSGSGSLALKLADGTKVWESMEVEAPEIPSPVMADGRLFVLSDHGTLACVKAATGVILWQHEFDTTFAASPVILNGTLFLTDIEGRTYQVEAADTFRLLATAHLGEACYTTLAAAGNRVYLRGAQHLYCIGEGTP